MKGFLHFVLAPICRPTCVLFCNPKMNLLRYCFVVLQANEDCIHKLQISNDTINFRTLLIQNLESSVKPPNLVGRYFYPSPHKAPNFGFCCTLAMSFDDYCVINVRTHMNNLFSFVSKLLPNFDTRVCSSTIKQQQ